MRRPLHLLVLVELVRGEGPCEGNPGGLRGLRLPRCQHLNTIASTARQHGRQRAKGELVVTVALRDFDSTGKKRFFQRRTESVEMERRS